LKYATEALQSETGFKPFATVSSKVPVLSFVHPTIHAHDIGTILDSEGVAIRSGHHCAMPLMQHLGVPATCRISLSFYNTTDDIDRCMRALHHAKEMFS
jgi:cysteine desulfurase/selenocysteine lyase